MKNELSQFIKYLRPHGIRGKRENKRKNTEEGKT